MKFEHAANVQHRVTTYYTAFLMKSDGSKVQIGSTQRKTGRGLLSLLALPAVVANLKNALGELADVVTIEKKRGDRLELSHGFAIVFGGTIRQEAE